ncbi:MAG: ATP-binding protein [Spirochaetales bacterium]|nr:ATP-binding protein [Spirochaetia bacterium]MDD7460441.1 ATP-binding protein [Spirochaetales bacterium]MDD7611834.1 ATP-binding protein [Spirochaetales bacterium]MDY5914094.1 ATP-binding protein [Treponema sp.]
MREFHQNFRHDASQSGGEHTFYIVDRAFAQGYNSLMVGRKHEIEELNKLYNSGKAELVAIYGRRRIGKTYLVDETFKNKITFRHAGLSPVEADNMKGSILKKQLEHFYFSLQLQGMPKSHRPDSWFEAFFMLEKLLESKDNGERQVIFLDELPWMDTPQSGFITAFEGFWNTWACHRSNLMVVVCGSANSWILDKLINNHGGLYNRVTYEIKLSPFTLGECREFFDSINVVISDYDITQSYMILGGVPFYLGYFERGISLAQTIDKLFFQTNAKLKDEYNRLFESGFSNPEFMKNLIKFLSKRNAGYTRKEIVEGLSLADGGYLSKSLKALIASDFIIEYIPFGLGKREIHYKLVDPFCKFCLKFVNDKNSLDEAFWQQNVTSSSINSWRGFAFENVCFNHIDQIKAALGISGVVTTHSAWSKRPDEKDDDGAQIDLIISRKDNVVNMCEIKFYSSDYTVNKAYHSTLVERQKLLSTLIPKKSVVHGTLITTFNLTYNEYSGDFVKVINLEDLFKN